MFITPKNRGYNRRDEQTAAGRFLILVQPKGGMDTVNAPIRALVRYTRLTQFGHFMMGSARAFGHKITLSGAYGNDGLPCTVPAEVYAKSVPIPPDLVDAWNNGGGWNSAGSEASVMLKWAKAAFPETKHA